MTDRKTAPVRLDWIDVARGIGIVLMVQGHVLRSLISAGTLAPSPALMAWDALVYAFHMPMFFVMSGLFAYGARDRGWRPILRNRALTMVYPYFLWSLVQGGMTMLAAGDVNHPLHPRDLAAIVVTPLAQFWFLYSLFLCSLAVMLPRRLVLFVLAPLSLLVTPLFGNDAMLPRAGYYFIYYALGIALSARGLTTLLGGPQRTLLVAVGAWLAYALLFPTMFDWTTLKWNQGALPSQAIGIAGAIGMLAVARLIAPWTPFLARLGRVSMPVFLLHVIAYGSVRAVLARLGNPIGGGIALAGLLTLAGLALPWLAQIVAARLGIEQWLGFGRSASGPARLAPPLELAGTKADVLPSNEEGKRVP